MKFQKFLLSLLVISLSSFDIYTAQGKNPFYKNPTAPAGSDWDDDAPKPNPRPKNPIARADSSSDEEDWYTPQPTPKAQPAVSTRAKSPVKTPTAEPAPAPIAKAEPARPLTLAERKKMLEESQAIASGQKQAPSMHQDPTLTVQQRIALKEAEAQRREEENKTRVWKAQIDRDAAAASKERERRTTASTAKVDAPATAIPSLAQAEAKVQAAQEQLNRDRTNLVKAEIQLATTALHHAKQESSLAKTTPTRGELLLRALEEEETARFERGRQQMEHERKVWEEVEHVAPWQARENAAQAAQLEKIILVIRQIKNVLRRPSPRRVAM